MIDTPSVVRTNSFHLNFTVTRAILVSLICASLLSCDSASRQHPEPQNPALQNLSLPAFHFRQGDSVSVDLTDPVEPNATLVYSVEPTLPAGLSLDAQSGHITGDANGLSTSTDYALRAVADGRIEYEIPFTLGLHPQLPAALVHLDDRYSAEVVLADAAIPVRMAMTPDGRLFYAELQTGDIRIIERDGQLQEVPFATLDVESGHEKGLLGLALDPEFASNGFVYVYATVALHNGAESHAEIVRFTAVQNRAVDKTVIVDNLPVADLHNGGELVFDKSGHLFLGRGDIDDVATAQREGGFSGRVLRYTRDGAIPADNPYPGSAEWSRGLRNTFAMALHPQTGELFGADAGPASDDELNYLQPGKNFVWGMDDEPQGSGIGFTIKVWEEVITPTAIFFHSGEGIVPSLKNQLFLSSYNEANVRRVVLAGDRFTDYIREIEFATLSDDAVNKPLHIMEGQAGTIYMSTFNAIYRIYPH